jgi:CheY-like chemotaxis protein
MIKNSGAKILIVDDNLKFLQELQEILELYGYQIICVRDGKSVLAVTIEEKPNLILLDLKMEGINGFQIANKLAHLPATHSIPIIIMSAFLTEEDVEETMQIEAIKACLNKPFKVKDLIFEIKKMLE